MKTLILASLSTFFFTSFHVTGRRIRTTYVSVQNDLISYETAPSNISMHWNNRAGLPIGNFASLFDANPNIVFATNGGMFAADNARTPLGLYVEKGKELHKMRKVNNPNSNFGLEPQGVFLITNDDIAKVVAVNDAVVNAQNLKFANQSAPLLVHDGKMNARLPKSKSVNIRNGVGILMNGNVLFIVSKQYVTFREFAQMFIDRGCVSALSLDEAISEGLTPDRALHDPCSCYGPFLSVSR
ncbi:MAG: hypothetical protein EOP04_14385 [Proteobacteria bacterium]|nr:MAG: hypothetical protein EOP04_14385 [Pseudomonadota bacterium]